MLTILFCTVLWKIFRNNNIIAREKNYKLEKVNIWLKTNILTVANFSINNAIMENLSKCNYLGIMIKDRLSRNFHDEINRISKAIGNINYLKF